MHVLKPGTVVLYSVVVEMFRVMNIVTNAQWVFGCSFGLMFGLVLCLIHCVGSI